MGQIHSAIRGIALAFLRMHHVGLVEVDGILGLDFGLTEWTDIPEYKSNDNSIEKLCEKIIRHGSAASAQAYRLGSWMASEVSRENLERPLCELLENCYASVMTTMNFVKDPSTNQLESPIPESPQWVKDELETHRFKRRLLTEMNWTFCGAYNSELREDPPIDWGTNMSKLFPNWRTMRPPSSPDHIQMPNQKKPWDAEVQIDAHYQFIPIKVPGPNFSGTGL